MAKYLINIFIYLNQLIQVLIVEVQQIIFQTIAQPSMAKFTDLAELVSKIEEPSPSSNVSQSSFDTDEGRQHLMMNFQLMCYCVLLLSFLM